MANHIVPDSIFNNQLADYKPYGTPGDHGSLSKAQAALKGSKYDTKGNGMCTASACKNILLVADTRQVDTKMLPVLQANAKKIGITFKVRTVKGAYPTLQTPKNNVADLRAAGLGQGLRVRLDVLHPADGELRHHREREPELLPRRPHAGIAKKVGAKGSINNVPSIDPLITACQSLTVPQENLSCWENLDKKLMTNIVPWIPYLWSTVTRITSTNVTQYEFDQFSTTPAYAHIAVK